jgi:hypothetical protein
LFARLHPDLTASRAVLPTLSRLFRQVRSADPGSTAFFDRPPAADVSPVEIWVHSTPAVCHAAGVSLRAETEQGTGTLAVQYAVARPVLSPSAYARDVTDELAAASSEFALNLPPGGPGGELDVAVPHLRGLTELMPTVVRSPFLFACWQHWSSTLTPRHRAELAAAAHLPAPLGLRPLSWSGYFDRVGRIIRRQQSASAPSSGHLVLHHAAATHDRAGMSAAGGALSALTLRAEYTGGAGRGTGRS